MELLDRRLRVACRAYLRSNESVNIIQPSRPTYRPNYLRTYRPTAVPTYRPTDLPTYRPTDLPTYRPTDLQTY